MSIAYYNISINIFHKNRVDGSLYVPPYATTFYTIDKIERGYGFDSRLLHFKGILSISGSPRFLLSLCGIPRYHFWLRNYRRW